MFYVPMCLRVSAIALVLLQKIDLPLHHFLHLFAETVFVVVLK